MNGNSNSVEKEGGDKSSKTENDLKSKDDYDSETSYYEEDFFEE